MSLGRGVGPDFWKASSDHRGYQEHYDLSSRGMALGNQDDTRMADQTPDISTGQQLLCVFYG